MHGTLGTSGVMLQRQNMSKTILVTGGSGFIGTVVCKQLVEAGYNVVNIDRKKKDIDGVTQYPFDISNKQVEGLLKLLQPDTVIHLAADHEVGRSSTEPAVFYSNNVRNTIDLLNNCIEAGIKNFIFSGSSSVYGDTMSFPTPETTPCDPQSVYARTKYMIEQILEDYKSAYDFNYVSLRYFNAAGAMPDASHGYTQDPATHLIPIVAKAYFTGNTVKVFGRDYQTLDGTCERDYTHVCDIANAHLLALDYLSDGGTESVFNIGEGVSKSVLAVLTRFNELGYTVEEEFAEPREGDVERTCADISKAKELLGYEPKYSFDDIIHHAVAWEKKNTKRKRKDA